VMVFGLLVLVVLSKFEHFAVLNDYFKEAILVILLIAHIVHMLTIMILNRRM